MCLEEMPNKGLVGKDLRVYKRIGNADQYNGWNWWKSGKRKYTRKQMQKLSCLSCDKESVDDEING